MLHTAQTPDATTWEAGLDSTAADVRAHEPTARKVTRDWWAAFWKRSFIFIDTPARSAQAARNSDKAITYGEGYDSVFPHVVERLG